MEMTISWCTWDLSLNTLRPRQDGHHFPDDIFKTIFLNENVWLSTKISLNFYDGCPINHFPALVQIMAWRRPGDKPLSDLMMVSLMTHICITWPQWDKQPAVQIWGISSDYLVADSNWIRTDYTRKISSLFITMPNFKINIPLQK